MFPPEAQRSYANWPSRRSPATWSNGPEANGAAVRRYEHLPAPYRRRPSRPVAALDRASAAHRTRHGSGLHHGYRRIRDGVCAAAHVWIRAHRRSRCAAAAVGTSGTGAVAQTADAAGLRSVRRHEPFIRRRLPCGARSAPGITAIVSFDRGFERVPGVTRIEPRAGCPRERRSARLDPVRPRQRAGGATGA